MTYYVFGGMLNLAQSIQTARPHWPCLAMVSATEAAATTSEEDETEKGEQEQDLQRQQQQESLCSSERNRSPVIKYT